MAAAFDLDAARAAKAEAAGESFAFTYGGEEFTIPTPKAWPIAVTDLLSQGKVVPAMEMLMNGQTERFMAHQPTIGDMETLFEGLAAWQGLKPGE